MVIKRVRLENFKAHKVFDREFGKFTVIFGRNGAGKSTILEAIFKAIYPDSGFGSEYIRRGEKGFKILIEFSNGYTLYLNYPLDKKPKISSPDGKILSVENFRRILHFPDDEDKFLFLSFFEQGSLDDFNREMFDNTRKILEVDFPQAILKAIEGVEREKRSQIKEIEDELRRRYGNWERNLRNLKIEISWAVCLEKRIGREILKLERERENLEKRKEELEKLVNDLRERKERIERIRGKINAIEEKRGEYEGEIDRLESSLNPELPHDPLILRNILEFLKNYKILEKSKEGYEEYEKLEELYKSVSNEYPEKLKKIEGKLEKLRKIYEALKKLRGKNWKNIGKEEELRKEYEKLIVEFKHHEKRLESLRIGGDKCPVCGEPMGKEKREKLIEESSKFLNWAKERIRILEGELELIAEASNLLEYKIYPALEEAYEIFGELAESWRGRILKELDDVLMEVEEMGISLRKEKDETEKEYQRMTEYYRGKLEILKDDWVRYINAKNQIERIAKNLKEAEKYLKFEENEIEENLKILERLNIMKENLAKLDEDLEKLKREFSFEDPSDIESNLRLYEQELGRVRERSLEVIQRIADLERKMREISNLRVQNEGKYGEIKKLAGEMGKLREGLEILKDFKSAVELGKRRFVSYAKEAFEYSLNDHFLHFFGFSDHFIKVEVDENFEPVFYTSEGFEVRRGRELSINRVGLSGGQRTALGLVYRLALRSLFPNSPKLLLLDEPTTHLDEERRIAVWRILWRISNERDVQVIAVTHDDAVEEVISKENIVRLA